MSVWVGTIIMVLETVLLAALLARRNASSPVRGMAAAVRLPAFWLSAALGGLALWATLVVQPPMQIAAGGWTSKALSASPSRDLAAGAVSVLISGIVQEALKVLAILAGVLLIRLTVRAARRSSDGAESDPVSSAPASHAPLSYAPLLGTAAGCSFGIVEAIWLVVLPVFQAGQPLPGLGVIERVFAIAFHAASATVLGVGLAKGKGIVAYIVAAFLHGLLNFGVVLKALWILDMVQVEWWVAAGSLVTLAIAWWWLPTLRTPAFRQDVR